MGAGARPDYSNNNNDDNDYDNDDVDDDKYLMMKIKKSLSNFV